MCRSFVVELCRRQAFKSQGVPDISEGVGAGSSASDLSPSHPGVRTRSALRLRQRGM